MTPRVAVLRSAVDPSGAGKQFDLAHPHLAERFTLTQAVISAGPDGLRLARGVVGTVPDLIHTLGPDAFRAVQKVALEHTRPGRTVPKWLATGAASAEPTFNTVPHLTATLSEYDHERDWSARLLPAPVQFSYRPAIAPPVPVRERGPGGEGKHVVLAAGGFDDFANLRLAAWAFDVLKYPHPDLQLVLLGDGPLRPDVLAFARSLAPDDFRVSSPGWVPNVRPYLASAALVVGTHTRGGAKFLLEAMATGVPVIAADTPDTRRIISHCETGLLVTPGSAVRMAEEAHRLLAAPDRRSAMVVAAQAAAAGYSVAVLAGAWAGTYHTLTSSASPRCE